VEQRAGESHGRLHGALTIPVLPFEAARLRSSELIRQRLTTTIFITVTDTHLLDEHASIWLAFNFAMCQLALVVVTEQSVRTFGRDTRQTTGESTSCIGMYSDDSLPRIDIIKVIQTPFLPRNTSRHSPSSPPASETALHSCDHTNRPATLWILEFSIPHGTAHELESRRGMYNTHPSDGGHCVCENLSVSSPASVRFLAFLNDKKWRVSRRDSRFEWREGYAIGFSHGLDIFLPSLLPSSSPTKKVLFNSRSLHVRCAMLHRTADSLHTTPTTTTMLECSFRRCLICLLPRPRTSGQAHRSQGSSDPQGEQRALNSLRQPHSTISLYGWRNDSSWVLLYSCGQR